MEADRPRKARLVLVQDGSPPSLRTVALLYPQKPRPFTPPWLAFELRVPHQLPDLRPGGLVEVRGEPGPGLRVDAGGVVLTPQRFLRQFKSGWYLPGYAEALGSSVVVHPSRRDEISVFARHNIGGDRDTTAHWTFSRWARRFTLELLLGLLTVGVLVAEAVWTLGRGTLATGGWVYAGPGGAGLIAVFISWWRRQRIRLALRTLMLVGAPPQEMRIRLWWGAGRDESATAWVSLYPPNVLPDADPHVSLPVVELPEGFDPPDGAIALVHGDPRPGQVVVVIIDDVRLLPAGVCRADVGPPLRLDGAASSQDRGA